jgi:serine/threonine-protein kinase HipA
MSDMMRLISASSTDPGADAWALLDFAAVNYVAGAPDGHSKNLSLLLLPGRTSIAPAYDMASGFPYDFGGVRTVALAIGGRRKLGEVVGKNWERAAVNLGLSPDEVRARVSRVAQAFPDAYASALSEVGMVGADGIKGRSLDRIARHCRQVVQQLSAGSGPSIMAHAVAARTTALTTKAPAFPSYVPLCGTPTKKGPPCRRRGRCPYHRSIPA